MSYASRRTGFPKYSILIVFLGNKRSCAKRSLGKLIQQLNNPVSFLQDFSELCFAQVPCKSQYGGFSITQCSFNLGTSFPSSPLKFWVPLLCGVPAACSEATWIEQVGWISSACSLWWVSGSGYFVGFHRVGDFVFLIQDDVGQFWNSSWLLWACWAGGVVLGRVNHEGREIAWLTSLSCGVLRGIFLAQEHVCLFA